MRLTILGGGNTGVAMAGELALGGHEVLLWEHPTWAEAVAPLREGRTVRLEGVGRVGAARLAAVTTDAAEALAWADTLLCSVPHHSIHLRLQRNRPHRQRHEISIL